MVVSPALEERNRVVREGRIEAAGLTGVGPDRLDADSEYVAVLREEFRRRRVEAWMVRPGPTCSIAPS